MEFIQTKQRTERCVKQIMTKLSSGLEYLNSLGVAHRDIKLENIMITTSVTKLHGEVYSPKYIDFGLSKVFLQGETSEDRYGTLAYCSPEILKGSTHTLTTDMWSLGVIFHIILSGTVPFISTEKNEFKKNIIKGKLQLTQPAFLKVSNDAKDLLTRMLCTDPAKRVASHLI